MRTTWKTIRNCTCVIGIVAIAGLVGCNSSDSDKSSNTAAIDSTIAANKADSIKNASNDKTVKTAKKRKMSVSMSANTTGKISKDKEGVYNRAESMPEFPGGQNALAAYIENHLDYPQQAVDDNTTGTVRVSFVIDEKGKVTRSQVAGDKKIGNGLDEQALKVVQQMPAWKPGKVKGKNVKTRLELPITFQLEA
jgi:TonB family protein